VRDEPPPTGEAERLRTALAEAVDARFETEHIPWFRQLVETASHTYARDDVELAARIIDAAMASVGFACERHPDSEGRFADHRVYAPPELSADASAFALVGHVDTVFPREMGFLDFEREGDTVRGPGTLDMKSGLSVIVFAIKALHQLAPELLSKLPLRFLMNSDEEVGSPSSRSLLENFARTCSGAMVFEGGRVEDKVITRRKGGGMFVFEVHGNAAHAGNNHSDGINAIHALSLMIPRIEAITDYERGITVNVGLIEGGTAKNTIPDRAKCVVDTRFIRVVDADEVVAKLRAIAADPFAGLSVEPERLRKVRVELSGRVTRPPMEASAGSQKIRLAYEAHAANHGLKIGEAPLQGGGSDANILSACGVPCVDGLGPFGRHFHKVEEWSSLASLKGRTQALACFMGDGLLALHEELQGSGE
jgi:glutamate carboxypeptidase